MTKEITIKKPFDGHVHLREIDGLMPHVLNYTARQFWGAVVMPNTEFPITTIELAKNYRRGILKIAKENGYNDFKPIMTCYLTDNTNVKNLEIGYEKKIWHAAKLYPLGATTNSDRGVSEIKKIYHVLEVMQEIGMPLLIHPETESARHEIPFVDRERVFINETLNRITKDFPELIISVEHVTTKEAVQFVEDSSPNVVATVTPQHLLYTIDALFHNGIPPYKPGMYAENMCLPILKYEEDVEYLRQAIMYGNKKHKFRAGTDSAPHTENSKKDYCSRCGCYNSYVAIELYASIFDEKGMFENENGIKTFEKFMSSNNLWMFDIKQKEESITLVKEEQIIPSSLPGEIRPFKAGQTIQWSIKY